MCEAKGLFPEDTVAYRLFPPEEGERDHGNLTQLAVECSHFAKTLASGHIWHSDQFRLTVWPGCKDPAHLYGQTCYQENVEDEWLVVYLLFELTRVYQELVATVIDTDGQFLLIEAAHQLPKWLKPETAENRVFIYRGQLHIVPKPRTPAEVPQLPVDTPTISAAVRLVRDAQVSTLADQSIQEAIQKRISKFPGCLQASLHRAHCYLPCLVAHVLAQDPTLVSAAVHTLCERDPDDMHFCRRMENFSPLRHPSVMATVTFTRCLYAKLLHQKFSPPRHSGFKLPPQGASRSKAHELGLKLTCGLEILLSKFGGRGMKHSEMVSGPCWTKFLQGLADRGYFQGEVEGSQKHQQLLQTAKEYYTGHLETRGEEGGKGEEGEVLLEDTMVAAGKKVAHILQTVSYDEKEILESQDLGQEDDDSWLHLSPEQLDQMMYTASGLAPPPSSKPHPPTEHELESLVFGMQSFMKKASTHKGAEFPWTADELPGVCFDPEGFLSTVESMLGGEEGGGSESDDVSESDEEEDEEMRAVMEQMDQELAESKVSQSFERAPPSDGSTAQLQPVDVDFNLVKNLLQSYSSQGGGAGPTSNILHSMGLHIPQDETSSNEEN